jgi:DNA-binding MarR family transcriptional regulator
VQPELRYGGDLGRGAREKHLGCSRQFLRFNLVFDDLHEEADIGRKKILAPVVSDLPAMLNAAPGRSKPRPDRSDRFVAPPKLPPATKLPDLGEAEMRLAQDLLFFACRDFTNAADKVLEELDLGRTHHRALHFIGRNPGLTVAALLAILRINKQSLARVLNQLLDQGYVSQAPGFEDRRMRLLTLTEQGQALERRLFDCQRELLSEAYRQAGPQAVDGFRTVMRAMMESGARAYMDGTGPAEDA